MQTALQMPTSEIGPLHSPIGEVRGGSSSAGTKSLFFSINKSCRNCVVKCDCARQGGGAQHPPQKFVQMIGAALNYVRMPLK